MNFAYTICISNNKSKNWYQYLHLDVGSEVQTIWETNQNHIVSKKSRIQNQFRLILFRVYIVLSLRRSGVLMSYKSNYEMDKAIHYLVGPWPSFLGLTKREF